jgi:hypothetical protein
LMALVVVSRCLCTSAFWSTIAVWQKISIRHCVGFYWDACGFVCCGRKVVFFRQDNQHKSFSLLILPTFPFSHPLWIAHRGLEANSHVLVYGDNATVTLPAVWCWRRSPPMCLSIRPSNVEPAGTRKHTKTTTSTQVLYCTVLYCTVL